MKKNLVGIFLLMVLNQSLKAQVIQIKYKQPSVKQFVALLNYTNELKQQVPDSATKEGNDKKVEKEFEKYKANSNSLSNSYQRAAKAFFDTEIRLREIISEKYSTIKDSLFNLMRTTTNLEEIEDLKLLIDKEEKKEKEEGIIVRRFNSLGKEMLYRDRRSKKFVLFPVRNEVDAQIYYNNSLSDNRSKFLQNNIIRFTPDGGKASLYNEVFADYAGPIRFGVGVLVSNKSTIEENISSTKQDSIIQKDAVQRLIGGGGNFVINLSWPIYDISTMDQRFVSKLSLTPKINLDVPKIGTEKEDYAFSSDFGIEGSTFYTLKNEVITLFANYRFGFASGNSTFFSNLLKTDEKMFMFNQLSLGFALGSAFRINWNVFFGDKFVKQNFNKSIGFSVIP